MNIIKHSCEFFFLGWSINTDYWSWQTKVATHIPIYTPTKTQTEETCAFACHARTYAHAKAHMLILTPAWILIEKRVRTQTKITQSVCFLTQTFQSGHLPGAALRLTVATQWVGVKSERRSANMKKFRFTAQNKESSNVKEYFLQQLLKRVTLINVNEDMIWHQDGK